MKPPSCWRPNSRRTISEGRGKSSVRKLEGQGNLSDGADLDSNPYETLGVVGPGFFKNPKLFKHLCANSGQNCTTLNSGFFKANCGHHCTKLSAGFLLQSPFRPKQYNTHFRYVFFKRIQATFVQPSVRTSDQYYRSIRFEHTFVTCRVKLFVLRLVHYLAKCSICL